MLGIRFLKVKPTEHVILFKKGKIQKEGAGQSFFYYAPSSSVVIVPAASSDVPFIFKETTVDYQEINIQGQFAFRVLEHSKLASVLDFSVNADGIQTGDGNEKLTTRLSNIVQVTVREKLSGLDLRSALKSGTEFTAHVRERVKDNDALKGLGVEISDFAILKISPTPDMSRALEAGARETLLKEADEAIYQRRNFAVEQERKIKENELQTQIAIEEKNKKIREEQMNIEIAVQEKQRQLEEASMNTELELESKRAELEKMKLQASIDLEEQKKKLIQSEASNLIESSRAKGEAMKLELAAFAGLSQELIEALTANQLNSSQIISRAMRDMAKNAEKIGNLNISPELLNSLMQNQG